MTADEWEWRERFEGIANTEENWLACPAPQSLLHRALQLGASERKQRLVGCACCRLVGHNLVYPESKDAVEIAERFADGASSVDELLMARDEAAAVVSQHHPPSRSDQHRRTEYVEHTSARVAVSVASAEDGWPFWEHLVDILEGTFTVAEFQSFGLDRTATEAAQCDLMRDIFGNPFRPLAADPAWLTSTVIRLAGSIYEDRAFDRMPILADALEDAGCDSFDILHHCRSDGPHVRGCWVLDALLGLS